MLRVILLTLALTLSAVPVAAGPVEDAEAAYERGDYETAVQLLRPLGEQGDAKAQHSLGFLYAKGQGVPQDYAEAVKWYRMAVEQGNDDAKATRDIVAKNMTPEQLAEAQRLAREWTPKE
jgi:TPR repeat protein